MNPILEACLRNGIDTLTGSGYSDYSSIRKATQVTDVLSAEWMDYRKDCSQKAFSGEPLFPPPTLEKDSITYDRCTGWTAHLTKGYLSLVVYSGSLMDGHREEPRCSFNIRIDGDRLDEILVPAATTQLQLLAIRKYEDEQEAKQKAAIEAIYRNLVGAQVNDT